MPARWRGTAPLPSSRSLPAAPSSCASAPSRTVATPSASSQCLSRRRGTLCAPLCATPSPSAADATIRRSESSGAERCTATALFVVAPLLSLPRLIVLRKYATIRRFLFFIFWNDLCCWQQRTPKNDERRDDALLTPVDWLHRIVASTALGLGEEWSIMSEPEQAAGVGRRVAYGKDGNDPQTLMCR